MASQANGDGTEIRYTGETPKSPLKIAQQMAEPMSRNLTDLNGLKPQRALGCLHAER